MIALQPASAIAGGYSPSAVRYVGIESWWGRRVWLEDGNERTQLPYSDGSVIAFAWGRSGFGARELALS